MLSPSNYSQNYSGIIDGSLFVAPFDFTIFFILAILNTADSQAVLSRSISCDTMTFNVLYLHVDLSF